MINRKRILITILIFVVISCMGLGLKCYNAYVVDEDTAPLVFLSDDTLQFYYLQNEEMRKLPTGWDIYSSYTRFDINKEKREEMILQLMDGIMPAIYNYETDEMEQLGDIREMEAINSSYSEEKSEYRFVPRQ